MSHNGAEGYGKVQVVQKELNLAEALRGVRSGDDDDECVYIQICTCLCVCVVCINLLYLFLKMKAKI